MPQFSFNKQLDFLTIEQKKDLSRYFKVVSSMMPHQLAAMSGLEYSEALSVIAILGAQGASKNKLLIYHNCDPTTPAGALPYGQGFPSLPWKCPLCDETVESIHELSFDVLAEITEPIVFV